VLCGLALAGVVVALPKGTHAGNPISPATRPTNGPGTTTGVTQTTNGVTTTTSTSVTTTTVQSSTTTQPPSNPDLTISPTGLGQVKVGATLAQIYAASGYRFSVVGDGFFQQSNAKTPRFPGTLGTTWGTKAPPGPWVVGCIVTSDKSVSTAAGIHVGDTVAQLKAAYGSSAVYVPQPQGGYNPVAGYVVQTSQGRLAFMLGFSGPNVIGEIAGGPDWLQPSYCTG
ncbi:MAG TPA: hypothetical protein VGS21_03725, partial [Acidimicrobiales bacterium]|nr:hypothetical protein [Acidimicrobiales bacterium]